MTNRQAHEEAAEMGLEDIFFIVSGIDPDAEYMPNNKDTLARLVWTTKGKPTAIDKMGKGGRFA
jgi:hypothetical protein